MSSPDFESFLPGLDRKKPNIARMYDYWLGGKDNFEADRAEAVRLTEISPLLPVLARENREFLARAVRYLTAEAGIRQFLDIGSGLPTAQNTHEVAQAIDPSCRVVYVDFDPMVISHARALLNTSTAEGRIAAVRGDLRDPAAILADPAVLRLINSDEPVAVILLLILHFLGVGEIRLALHSLIEWMAPGSYVVASFGSGEEDTAGRAAAEYRAGTLRNYPPEVITAFFAGLELLLPGPAALPELVEAAAWRQSPAPESLAGRDVHALAGVWRKPPLGLRG